MKAGMLRAGIAWILNFMIHKLTAVSDTITDTVKELATMFNDHPIFFLNRRPIPAPINSSSTRVRTTLSRLFRYRHTPNGEVVRLAPSKMFVIPKNVIDFFMTISSGANIQSTSVGVGRCWQLVEKYDIETNAGF